MKILYAVESVNLPGGYDRIIIEKACFGQALLSHL